MILLASEWWTDFANWLLQQLQALLQWLVNQFWQLLIFIVHWTFEGLIAILQLFLPNLGAVLTQLLDQHEAAVTALLPYWGIANDWFPFSTLFQALYLFAVAALIIIVVKYLWSLIP